MASRIDVQASGPRDALVHHGGSWAFDYSPLISTGEHRLVTRILGALPPLRFPINSAGELAEKLGGRDSTLTIAGRRVMPARLLRQLPAHYFPIASAENFVEKLAAIVALRRSGGNVAANPKQATGAGWQSLVAQLSRVQFPLRQADDLVRHLEKLGPIRVGSHVLQPRMLKAILPANLFPVRSADELLRWAGRRLSEAGAMPGLRSPSASRSGPSGHAPALGAQTAFGSVTRKPAPAMHRRTEREPGHISDAEAPVASSASAARQVRLQLKR